jgi:hypothetical protein
LALGWSLVARYHRLILTSAKASARSQTMLDAGMAASSSHIAK